VAEKLAMISFKLSEEDVRLLLALQERLSEKADDGRPISKVRVFRLALRALAKSEGVK
jgi:hypothetical protein